MARPGEAQEAPRSAPGGPGFQEGHPEVVAKLIAANADVNIVMGVDHATPLYIACCKGHTEVVTALIAANADVNQALANGATPLYLAYRGVQQHRRCQLWVARCPTRRRG